MILRTAVSAVRLAFCGVAMALALGWAMPALAQIATMDRLPETEGPALAELTDGQLARMGFPPTPTDLAARSFDAVFVDFIRETRPGAQGMPGFDIVGRVRAMLDGPEQEPLPCGRRANFVGPDAKRIDSRRMQADGAGDPPFTLSRWVFYAEGCGVVRLLSLFVLDREDGQFRVNVLPVDHSLLDLRLLSEILPEMLKKGQKAAQCKEIELDMARPFGYRRNASPKRLDWSEFWVMAGCGRKAGFRIDMVQQPDGNYRHQIDSVPMFQK